MRTYGTYGTRAGRIGVMTKTTVYLPEELKAALSREAARTRKSEAEIIRSALEAQLGVGSDHPTPGWGLVSGPSLTVEEMDEAFAEGFGIR